MLNSTLKNPDFSRVYTLSQLDEVTSQLAPLLDGVVLLIGEMGAGKTTLVKSVCRALGVTDEVSSPTFALVNEYLDGKGNAVYHFDLYRLESEEEALDFGVDEYLDSGALCLVEWPEKISKFLPQSITVIKLTDIGGERQLDCYLNRLIAELN
jgi:tRNA threonylcarbamoyladenosine biosynthesis protein TsaE